MAFLRSSVTPFMSAHLNYPKREATIFDLQISSISSPHNCIESGTHLIAFQATTDAGRLAVVPIGTKGRTPFNELGHIFIANQPLTDFKFLKYPSDSDVLVATTRAGNVKLFTLKGITDGPDKSINSPTHQFDTALGAVEALSSHKSISNFFAVGGDQGWAAFDAEISGQEVVGGTAKGPVKAIDWGMDGHQIALLQTVDKKRISTVIDARSNEFVLEYDAHNSFGRECRIIHGGKYIISSGFNDHRFQEIVVYDTVAGKVFVRQAYDKSISFLIPAFDEDSKLLFLGAKGSNLIRNVDVTNMDIANPNQVNCSSQTIGFCLTPKLKCDVMAAEVQRVYQLHQGGIAPIPCNVVRRSYLEFHPEIFPDTDGLESGGTVEEWKTGKDQLVKKINLRPSDAPIIGIIGGATITKSKEASVKDEKKSTIENAKNGISKPVTIQKGDEKPVAPTPIIRKTQPKTAEASNVKLREAPPPRPISHSSQVASRIYESRSPYYNIKVLPSKPKTITDVRDINSRISPDGTFFAVSGKYAAVAMSKTEGSVAIFDLELSGRTPDGSLDAIFNRAPVFDLAFDPFNDNRILCALSSGVIKVWDINEADYCTNKAPPKRDHEPGMKNVITDEDDKYATLAKLTPVVEVKCQLPKITLVKYHPVVANLVAVAGSNGAIHLVSLENGEELIKANYHKSTIVSLAWSSDGSYLLSIDRDSNFILADIRKGNDGILAQTLFKSKSPRALFTGYIGNEFIFVTYLEGALQKWVLMDLELKPVKEENLGSSGGSQGLRTFFDYDSGIVFMASKGSPGITMAQVSFDGLICDILPTTLPSPHQAIALMPKKVVDPTIIEVVRVIRLTNNAIETLSMIVPRREKNLFFRELYPNALVTWESSQTLDDWLAFKKSQLKYVDLKPDNMTEIQSERQQLSSPLIASEKPPVSKLEKETKIETNTPSDVKKTQDTVLQEWSSAMPLDKTGKMEQDDIQGVDDEEWEEITVEDHM